MHEPHREFYFTENWLVSISPPLTHHPSNFSHAFPLCSLYASSNKSKEC
jgi:hypothetical protein